MRPILTGRELRARERAQKRELEPVRCVVGARIVVTTLRKCLRPHASVRVAAGTSIEPGEGVELVTRVGTCWRPWSQLTFRSPAVNMGDGVQMHLPHHTQAWLD